jgi:hypothetical protein
VRKIAAVVGIALVALATAAPAAPANPPQNGWGFGIADGNDPGGGPFPWGYDIFASAGWKKLRVKVYRVGVPWDAWNVPSELDAARRKIDRASAYPQEVMVTFGKRWGETAPPTVEEYGRAVEPFVRAFNGKVRWWGPANEPNYGEGWTGSDPRGQGPKLAAGYYQRLRTILMTLDSKHKLISPDFHDAYISRSTTDFRLKPSPYDPTRSLVRDWIESYKAAGGGFGAKSAFHPYGGVHRSNTASTLDFLAAVPNEVWFTEVGSIVSSSMGVYHTEAEQNAEVSFLEGVLANLDPRITRVYYYHQREPKPDWGWDSGLQAPDGRLRDAWVTYCRFATHGATDPNPPDCNR